MYWRHAAFRKGKEAVCFLVHIFNGIFMIFNWLLKSIVDFNV